MTEKETKSRLQNLSFRFGRANMNIPVKPLSRSEFITLLIIRHYREKNPGSPGIGAAELSYSCRMQPPAMSRLLNTMEEKGLVERRSNPESRRKICITLTEKGEQFRKQGDQAVADYYDSVIGQMGEEKMERFLSLWEELVDIMEQNYEGRKGEA